MTSTGSPGGQTARYQRSASGMVGAMLVLLLVIGGFIAFRELNRTTLDPPTRTVDYEQVAAAAREQASFDLRVPATLPAGWRATSATYTPRPDEAWHLGLLTGEENYVGLEQATNDPASMAETYVGQDATRGATVKVDGTAWTSWSDEDGDDALVRREGEVTTLVVSTAGRDTLVDFVAGLR